MNVAAVRSMTLNRERARLQLLGAVDSQTCVTRCAKCSWHYRGSVRDGKSAFRTHIELKHNERRAA